MATGVKKREAPTAEAIVAWLSDVLEASSFDDVSNNGLQLARRGGPVTRVAFAVDASAASVRAAAAARAQLLVVHHGFSWRGGVKRITGGIYEVVSAAMAADLAVAAFHLPLDAHPKYGNNALWAKELGLKNLKPAFPYCGREIGLIGTDGAGRRIGVCSGGGGSFAEAAKAAGCAALFTGEADWGETVAAENCGIALHCAGHYESETYGVRTLAELVRKRFPVSAVWLPRAPAARIDA